MQKIRVKIAKDGSVEYSVNGVKGKSCRDLTRAIDEVVGSKVVETKNTSEYAQVEETEREKVRGR